MMQMHLSSTLQGNLHRVMWAVAARIVNLVKKKLIFLLSIYRHEKKILVININITECR
jgi:hypothetical protein